MKRKIILCILFLFLISVLCSFTNKDYRYETKNEITLDDLSQTEKENIEGYIESAEKEGLDNVKVNKELREILKEYELEETKLVNLGDNERLEEVERNKKSVIEAINYYNDYQKSKNTVLESKVASKKGDDNGALIAAYATLLAGLKAEGLELTLELVQHMKNNYKLNSTYKPKNADIITHTKMYEKLFSGEEIDELKFESDENIYELDAACSIHGFNYNISRDRKSLVITDRNDYKYKTYENVKKAGGNNIMLALQNCGMAIPFYVVLEYSIGETNKTTKNDNIIVFNEYSNYFEKYDMVGVGETIEYNMIVNADVNKTIQTFGPDDTIIELFDEYGNFVAYDDDSGYNQNACICPYLTKDRRYVLKVRMKENGCGNIRIGFCSTTSCFFDQIHRIKDKGYFRENYEEINITGYKYLSNFYILNHNFETNLKIETKNVYSNEYVIMTRIFMIDPRRSDYYTGTDEDNAPLFIKSTDNGVKAVLNVNMNFFPLGEDFLVLSSIQNLNTSGTYTLKVVR